MQCPNCKMRQAYVAGTAGKGCGDIYACGCGWRGYNPGEDHLREAVSADLQREWDKLHKEEDE